MKERNFDDQGKKLNLTATDSRKTNDSINIYRHLTSISNHYPSAKEVQNLCINSQEFHINLPQKRVLSSREIRIPVSRSETKYEQVEVERYKTIVHEEDEIIYGVIVGKIRKEEQIPYKEMVVQEVQKITSGTCVGSEYILSDD